MYRGLGFVWKIRKGLHDLETPYGPSIRTVLILFNDAIDKLSTILGMQRGAI